MKTCTKCKVEKPLDEFSTNGKNRINSHCKPCRSARYREYYQTPQEKLRMQKKNAQKKKDAREFVIAEKSKPCTDCKMSYPFYVMQFDHLDESTKKYNIGWMVSHSYTPEAIAKEIAKCELVCANCHAERTYRRMVDKCNTNEVY